MNTSPNSYTEGVDLHDGAQNMGGCRRARPLVRVKVERVKAPVIRYFYMRMDTNTVLSPDV